jgi:hypothetical protein
MNGEKKREGDGLCFLCEVVRLLGQHRQWKFQARSQRIIRIEK